MYLETGNTYSGHTYVSIYASTEARYPPRRKKGPAALSTVALWVEGLLARPLGRFGALTYTVAAGQGRPDPPPSGLVQALRGGFGECGLQVPDGHCSAECFVWEGKCVHVHTYIHTYIHICICIYLSILTRLAHLHVPMQIYKVL